jgi:hypothetical protein
MTDHRNDRHACPQRQLDEPHASLELDLVPLGPRTEDLVITSGVDEHGHSLGECFGGVLPARGHLADLAHEGAKDWNAEGRVERQPHQRPLETEAAIPGGKEGRCVRRQDAARVVANEQHGAAFRNVLQTFDLGVEVARHALHPRQQRAQEIDVALEGPCANLALGRLGPGLDDVESDPERTQRVEQIVKHSISRWWNRRPAAAAPCHVRCTL